MFVESGLLTFSTNSDKSIDKGSQPYYSNECNVKCDLSTLNIHGVGGGKYQMKFTFKDIINRVFSDILFVLLFFFNILINIHMHNYEK